MAYKYLRRKRTYKSSQGFVAIDWSNPLAEGLIYLGTGEPGGINFVNGSVGVDTSGVTDRITAEGPGWINPDGTSRYRNFSIPATTVPTNKITLAGLWFPIVISEQVLICLHLASGASRAQLQLNSSGYIQVFTNSGNFGSATPLAVGQLAFIAGTIGMGTTNGTALYLNGVKVATGTLTAGAATYNTVTLGSRFNSGYGLFMRGGTPLQMAWNRALSDEEHAALAANPWQLFLRSPRHFFYPGIPSGTNTYTFSASGSVSFTGAVSILKTRTFVPSGSIGFSGASVLARTRTLLPSGAITFSGTAPFTSSASYQFNPSGSINFSGTALMYKTKVLLPSGGVTFSGSAGLIFIPDGVVPSTDNRYITVGAGRSMRIS